MPKETRSTKPINNARESPYPLRSSRTKKYEEHGSFSQSEWEDVQCVICQESPHNAVLLLCTSCPTGCLPYMCDTSARHSNCLTQFRKNTEDDKHLNVKTLSCPLCRGEVFDTRKVMSSARRFMNAKSRPCPFDDCEFAGSYAHLDKHLKIGHLGVIPPKIDPMRQQRWEQMERLEIVNHHFPNNVNPQRLFVDLSGSLENFTIQISVINDIAPEIRSVTSRQ